MVPSPTEGVFRLFVYGTLKKGFPNHDRFCATTIRIRMAWIRGRLFETPWGHPVVELPTGEVLERGSRDPGWDWARQRALEMTRVSHQDLREHEVSCERVQGELLDFLNPDGWLEALDRFEEFDPIGTSRFERVLVRAYLDDPLSVPAWVYVGSTILNGHDFPWVPSGRWQ